MATTHLDKLAVNTCGNLPAPGAKAPDFTLVTKDLAEISLADFAGRNVVLNIFPSLDTPVCAASVRRFNQAAAALDNSEVLCVSKDLPFAAQRFCTVNDIENVVTASAFRSDFGRAYGVEMTDGPLRGLLARAVVVIRPDGTVAYSHLSPDITGEPDYDAALAAL